MNQIAAGFALVVSLLLTVAFARALPAAVDKERTGRQNELQAVCEPGMRPEMASAGLGRLPVTAPPFSLKDYAGREISLADYKGRVVLLNFWATWCPTCVDEMPSFEQLVAAEKGRPFALVTVTVDEEWEAVRKFFAGGTKMTVLIDKERDVPKRYGTEKFPETFLIDKQGNVRFLVVSNRNWMSPDVRACLDRLIDE